ncbi:hypothetical protein PHYSODRAFT_307981 [Phytophthora sojae]|uniref:Uncharacterized protein n=1 Tax=Phytophthora sojae (strain P6497) TaxID=1094619 RepID=G5AHD8_PHYSP|nr:hypothetical protein PHYSODRAFT_307981 [Phytophthora sojae]EGZ05116.1 hypothetical protein PHYSODRAFT_307981 [Phytophthora sojae]|eukprot:XP_009539488.1 hypothetical protein PHYSODRAFT_307981 [Phytophthora sojae]
MAVAASSLPGLAGRFWLLAITARTCEHATDRLVGRNYGNPVRDARRWRLPQAHFPAWQVAFGSWPLRPAPASTQRTGRFWLLAITARTCEHATDRLVGRNYGNPVRDARRWRLPQAHCTAWQACPYQLLVSSPGRFWLLAITARTCEHATDRRVRINYSSPGRFWLLAITARTCEHATDRLVGRNYGNPVRDARRWRLPQAHFPAWQVAFGSWPLRPAPASTQRTGRFWLLAITARTCEHATDRRVRINYSSPGRFWLLAITARTCEHATDRLVGRNYGNPVRDARRWRLPQAHFPAWQVCPYQLLVSSPGRFWLLAITARTCEHATDRLVGRNYGNPVRDARRWRLPQAHFPAWQVAFGSWPLRPAPASTQRTGRFWLLAITARTCEHATDRRVRINYSSPGRFWLLAITARTCEHATDSSLPGLAGRFWLLAITARTCEHATDRLVGRNYGNPVRDARRWRLPQAHFPAWQVAFGSWPLRPAPASTQRTGRFWLLAITARTCEHATDRLVGRNYGNPVRDARRWRLPQAHFPAWQVAFGSWPLRPAPASTQRTGRFWLLAITARTCEHATDRRVRINYSSPGRFWLLAITARTCEHATDSSLPGLAGRFWLLAITARTCEHATDRLVGRNYGNPVRDARRWRLPQAHFPAWQVAFGSWPLRPAPASTQRTGRFWLLAITARTCEHATDRLVGRNYGNPVRDARRWRLPQAHFPAWQVAFGSWPLRPAPASSSLPGLAGRFWLLAITARTCEHATDRLVGRNYGNPVRDARRWRLPQAHFPTWQVAFGSWPLRPAPASTQRTGRFWLLAITARTCEHATDRRVRINYSSPGRFWLLAITARTCEHATDRRVRINYSSPGRFWLLAITARTCDHATDRRVRINYSSPVRFWLLAITARTCEHATDRRVRINYSSPGRFWLLAITARTCEHATDRLVGRNYGNPVRDARRWRLPQAHFPAWQACRFWLLAITARTCEHATDRRVRINYSSPGRFWLLAITARTCDHATDRSLLAPGHYGPHLRARNGQVTRPKLRSLPGLAGVSVSTTRLQVAFGSWPLRPAPASTQRTGRFWLLAITARTCEHATDRRVRINYSSPGRFWLLAITARTCEHATDRRVRINYSSPGRFWLLAITARTCDHATDRLVGRNYGNPVRDARRWRLPQAHFPAWQACPYQLLVSRSLLAPGHYGPHLRARNGQVTRPKLRRVRINYSSPGRFWLLAITARTCEHATDRRVRINYSSPGRFWLLAITARTCEHATDRRVRINYSSPGRFWLLAITARTCEHATDRLLGRNYGNPVRDARRWRLPQAHFTAWQACRFWLLAITARTCEHATDRLVGRNYGNPVRDARRWRLPQAHFPAWQVAFGSWPLRPAPASTQRTGRFWLLAITARTCEHATDSSLPGLAGRFWLLAITARTCEHATDRLVGRNYGNPVRDARRWRLPQAHFTAWQVAFGSWPLRPAPASTQRTGRFWLLAITARTCDHATDRRVRINYSSPGRFWLLAITARTCEHATDRLVGRNYGNPVRDARRWRLPQAHFPAWQVAFGSWPLRPAPASTQRTGRFWLLAITARTCEHATDRRVRINYSSPGRFWLLAITARTCEHATDRLVGRNYGNPVRDARRWRLPQAHFPAWQAETTVTLFAMHDDGGCRKLTSRPGRRVRINYSSPGRFWLLAITARTCEHATDRLVGRNYGNPVRDARRWRLPQAHFPAWQVAFGSWPLRPAPASTQRTGRFWLLAITARTCEHATDRLVGRNYGNPVRDARRWRLPQAHFPAWQVAFGSWPLRPAPASTQRTGRFWLLAITARTCEHATDRRVRINYSSPGRFWLLAITARTCEHATDRRVRINYSSPGRFWLLAITARTCEHATDRLVGRNYGNPVRDARRWRLPQAHFPAWQVAFGSWPLRPAPASTQRTGRFWLLAITARTCEHATDRRVRINYSSPGRFWLLAITARTCEHATDSSLPGLAGRFWLLAITARTCEHATDRLVGRNYGNPVRDARRWRLPQAHFPAWQVAFGSWPLRPAPASTQRTGRFWLLAITARTCEHATDSSLPGLAGRFWLLAITARTCEHATDRLVGRNYGNPVRDARRWRLPQAHFPAWQVAFGSWPLRPAPASTQRTGRFWLLAITARTCEHATDRLVGRNYGNPVRDARRWRLPQAHFPAWQVAFGSWPLRPAPASTQRTGRFWLLAITARTCEHATDRRVRINYSSPGRFWLLAITARTCEHATDRRVRINYSSPGRFWLLAITARTCEHATDRLVGRNYGNPVRDARRWRLPQAHFPAWQVAFGSWPLRPAPASTQRTGRFWLLAITARTCEHATDRLVGRNYGNPVRDARRWRLPQAHCTAWQACPYQLLVSSPGRFWLLAITARTCEHATDRRVRINYSSPGRFWLLAITARTCEHATDRHVRINYSSPGRFWLLAITARTCEHATDRSLLAPGHYGLHLRARNGQACPYQLLVSSPGRFWLLAITARTCEHATDRLVGRNYGNPVRDARRWRLPQAHFTAWQACPYQLLVSSPGRFWLLAITARTCEHATDRRVRINYSSPGRFWLLAITARTCEHATDRRVRINYSSPGRFWLLAITARTCEHATDRRVRINYSSPGRFWLLAITARTCEHATDRLVGRNYGNPVRDARRWRLPQAHFTAWQACPYQLLVSSPGRFWLLAITARTCEHATDRRVRINYSSPGRFWLLAITARTCEHATDRRVRINYSSPGRFWLLAITARTCEHATDRRVRINYSSPGRFWLLAITARTCEHATDRRVRINYSSPGRFWLLAITARTCEHATDRRVRINYSSPGRFWLLAITARTCEHATDRRVRINYSSPGRFWLLAITARTCDHATDRRVRINYSSPGRFWLLAITARTCEHATDRLVGRNYGNPVRDARRWRLPQAHFTAWQACPYQLLVSSPGRFWLLAITARTCEHATDRRVRINYSSPGRFWLLAITARTCEHATDRRVRINYSSPGRFWLLAITARTCEHATDRRVRINYSSPGRFWLLAITACTCEHATDRLVGRNYGNPVRDARRWRLPQAHFTAWQACPYQLLVSSPGRFWLLAITARTCEHATDRLVGRNYGNPVRDARRWRLPQAHFPAWQVAFGSWPLRPAPASTQRTGRFWLLAITARTCEHATDRLVGRNYGNPVRDARRWRLPQAHFPAWQVAFGSWPLRPAPASTQRTGRFWLLAITARTCEHATDRRVRINYSSPGRFWLLAITARTCEHATDRRVRINYSSPGRFWLLAITARTCEHATDRRVRINYSSPGRFWLLAITACTCEHATDRLVGRNYGNPVRDARRWRLPQAHFTAWQACPYQLLVSSPGRFWLLAITARTCEHATDSSLPGLADTSVSTTRLQVAFGSWPLRPAPASTQRTGRFWLLAITARTCEHATDRSLLAPGHYGPHLRARNGQACPYQLLVSSPGRFWLLAITARTCEHATDRLVGRNYGNPVRDARRWRLPQAHFPAWQVAFGSWPLRPAPASTQRTGRFWLLAITARTCEHATDRLVGRNYGNPVRDARRWRLPQAHFPAWQVAFGSWPLRPAPASTQRTGRFWFLAITARTCEHATDRLVGRNYGNPVRDARRWRLPQAHFPTWQVAFGSWPLRPAPASTQRTGRFWLLAITARTCEHATDRLVGRNYGNPVRDARRWRLPQAHFPAWQVAFGSWPLRPAPASTQRTGRFWLLAITARTCEHATDRRVRINYSSPGRFWLLAITARTCEHATDRLLGRNYGNPVRDARRWRLPQAHFTAWQVCRFWLLAITARTCEHATDRLVGRNYGNPVRDARRWRLPQAHFPTWQVAFGSWPLRPAPASTQRTGRFWLLAITARTCEHATDRRVRINYSSPGRFWLLAITARTCEHATDSSLPGLAGRFWLLAITARTCEHATDRLVGRNYGNPVRDARRWRLPQAHFPAWQVAFGSWPLRPAPASTQRTGRFWLLAITARTCEHATDRLVGRNYGNPVRDARRWRLPQAHFPAWQVAFGSWPLRPAPASTQRTGRFWLLAITARTCEHATDRLVGRNYGNPVRDARRWRLPQAHFPAWQVAFGSWPLRPAPASTQRTGRFWLLAITARTCDHATDRSLLAPGHYGPHLRARNGQVTRPKLRSLPGLAGVSVSTTRLQVAFGSWPLRPAPASTQRTGRFWLLAITARTCEHATDRRVRINYSSPGRFWLLAITARTCEHATDSSLPGLAGRFWLLAITARTCEHATDRLVGRNYGNPVRDARRWRLPQAHFPAWQVAFGSWPLRPAPASTQRTGRFWLLAITARTCDHATDRRVRINYSSPGRFWLLAITARTCEHATDRRVRINYSSPGRFWLLAITARTCEHATDRRVRINYSSPGRFWLLAITARTCDHATDRLVGRNYGNPVRDARRWRLPQAHFPAWQACPYQLLVSRSLLAPGHYGPHLRARNGQVTRPKLRRVRINYSSPGRFWLLAITARTCEHATDRRVRINYSSPGRFWLLAITARTCEHATDSSLPGLAGRFWLLAITARTCEHATDRLVGRNYGNPVRDARRWRLPQAHFPAWQVAFGSWPLRPAPASTQRTGRFWLLAITARTCEHATDRLVGRNYGNPVRDARRWRLPQAHFPAWQVAFGSWPLRPAPASTQRTG